jgi:hypothetical protein
MGFFLGGMLMPKAEQNAEPNFELQRPAELILITPA